MTTLDFRFFNFKGMIGGGSEKAPRRFESNRGEIKEEEM
jgi:hypothetical protein